MSLSFGRFFPAPLPNRRTPSTARPLIELWRSWFHKSRLGRFDDVVVPLPALVFQFDMLDQDSIGVGIEIRLGLKFRDPAAEHLVGDRQLAGFIIDFDDDVLAE